jgi:adenylate cyclase
MFLGLRTNCPPVLALSTEQGFAQWLVWGTILRGWALAVQDQEAESLAKICQGLAALV